MIRCFKNWYHFVRAVASVLYFRFPGNKLVVIGVTGTDGKTTTTTLLYHVLRSLGVKTSMITSVHAVIAGKEYDTGFHVTSPDSYYIQKYLREAFDHGDTHFVLEVTSHGLAQHRFFGTPFSVGVLTNITHEHLDWHRSFDEYMRTKFTLLKRSAIAILNRDDAEIYGKALPMLGSKKIITYGIRRDAMITTKNTPFKTSLQGEFNQYNCLAAITALYGLGYSLKKIVRAVSTFKGVVGRMEVIRTRPFKIVVDFAHTPNAIEQVGKTMRSLTKGKLIHVFGSAGLRDASKRPMMGKNASQYADTIILTEEDYRTENLLDIFSSIRKGISLDIPTYQYENRRDAISFALSIAKPGDTVLITGKGHEKSLCRGTVEYPWSDQEAVREILRKNT